MNFECKIHGPWAANRESGCPRCVEEARTIFRDVVVFLDSLPNDLGRPSLNGMRDQLRHRLTFSETGEKRDELR